jgi:hypothetical protein
MTMRRARVAVYFWALAQEFGVSKSTAHRIVTDMEAILEETIAAKNGAATRENKILCAVADATETQIQRPGKNQMAYYSGKARWHTAKTETMIDLVS